MSRFVFIVLDGVGVGALPDAARLRRRRLRHAGESEPRSRAVAAVPREARAGQHRAHAGRASRRRSLWPCRAASRLISAGKDTTVGHWEHMGLVTDHALPDLPGWVPRGGPRPVRARDRPRGAGQQDRLRARRSSTNWARRTLPAGDRSSTRRPTACSRSPPTWTWCLWSSSTPGARSARGILQGPHAVARVIARPFSGRPGAFVRTKDRRDFSLPPPAPTYLDLLRDAGVPSLRSARSAKCSWVAGSTAEIKVASNDENLRSGARSAAAIAPTGVASTRACSSPTWWTSTWSGAIATTWTVSQRGSPRVDAALPAIVASLEPGDGSDHLRRSRGGPHHAEHRPQPGIRTTAAVPAAARLPGGRLPGHPGRHRVPRCTRNYPESGRRSVARSSPTAAPAGAGGGHTAARPFPGRAGILLSVRVGDEEAAEAASYLRARLGAAPEAAVILGSGLSRALATGRPATADDGVETITSADISYGDIPHWARGDVPGHPYRLVLAGWGGRLLLLLEGRSHGYEGFDLSELQLPVRTLATWGVGRILLTSSCGAVAPGLRPGDVVIATTVVDCQTHVICGGKVSRPEILPATAPALVERVLSLAGRPAWLSSGSHAAVPGPHYETEAELQHLRALGAATVSMSLAVELRAAHEVSSEVAALGLVVNAGPHQPRRGARGRRGRCAPASARLWEPSSDAGGIERGATTVAGLPRTWMPGDCFRRYILAIMSTSPSLLEVSAVITTHQNADFDALAAAVGAALLYPEAASSSPGRSTPTCASSCRCTGRTCPSSTCACIDQSKIRQLIVVDTADAERIGDLGRLCGKRGVEVVIFDHHESENPERPAFVKGENWVLSRDGAQATSMLYLLRERGVEIPRLAATIFALGIHEDTGSLTYPRTTIRDAEMLAASMRLGASQALIERYLHSALTGEQREVLMRMVDVVRLERVRGLDVHTWRSRCPGVRGRSERHRPQADGTHQRRGAAAGRGHGGPGVRHRPFAGGFGGRGRPARDPWTEEAMPRRHRRSSADAGPEEIIEGLLDELAQTQPGCPDRRRDHEPAGAASSTPTPRSPTPS